MLPSRPIAAAAALLALAVGPAAAQADDPASTRAPVATDLDNKGGALSDKLSETNGVVRPRGDVDPAIRKPAPAMGSMPVVKPGDVSPGTAK